VASSPARAGAEAHFEAALADPAGEQWPFERAQLRLDYGEWLRRRRRINDAKPVLTEALATFRRLSARSWAQRTETELRACGVAVTGTAVDRDAPEELTPQQRQARSGPRRETGPAAGAEYSPIHSSFHDCSYR